MFKNIQSKHIGLIVFFLSLFIYTITLEPTTSFWDCSEFILSAAKLEVNHPAGAPLFMLLGRLFSFLSFGNPAKIAHAINFMSGLFSALTIFFLFHVVFMLVKKISSNTFYIVGSAVIGSLTFAFTDSFWFSAVEGEVYALSMFFMVICFWAILKWEAHFGEPGNSRWILFIALMTGIGLGVHLLNLLIIPTATMIVIMKSYRYSLKMVFLSFFAGSILLLGVLYILTPLTLSFLAHADLLFVNTFKFPRDSGVISGIVFLGILFSLVIIYLQKKEKLKLALAVFSAALILTGFSIYAVNLIRSQADPPVNFGQPDNIYSLIDYLNREQYPKRPLLYGENYSSVVQGVKERKTRYFNGKEYEETDLPSEYVYAPETCSVFPRMYSSDPGHEEAYKSWVNIKGRKVRVNNGAGNAETVTIPTMSENLQFFLRFQTGYMFVRYFMWNFVGRQNDIQGRGELTQGNWISGIKFIDTLRLGPQNNLPGWMKNNRARNTYFFIPLILGLIGAGFHYRKDKVSFYSLLALFLIAGIGLVVYINEIPLVPRERDYVFVGAFMAFSIWIGFSFVGLAEYLNRKTPSKLISVLLFVVIFLGSPALLLSQNFNDHNRSNRYAARDFVANILKSCPENAILFTSGDNDTYPILYCQEVEEIRPDVRVVIMPFLSADWFIGQLKSQKNTKNGLQMIFPQEKMEDGQLDYVQILDKIDRKVDFKEILNFVNSDKPGTKLKTRNGDSLSFIPATHLYVNVSANGTNGQIPVSLENKQVLYKHQLAFWDIVASNATKRPICFVSKAEAQKWGLLNYLHMDGLVYQVVPEKNNMKSVVENPPFDTEKMYNLFMHDFRWGNVGDPKVYVDNNVINNANVFQLQNAFNTLAARLLDEGETTKAQEVLQKSIATFPVSAFQYNSFSLQLIDLLFNTGLETKGLEQLNGFINSVKSNLYYYGNFDVNGQRSLKQEIMTEMYYYQQLIRLIHQHKQEAAFPDIEKDFETYISRFSL